MERFENIKKPLTINNLTLKNRIIFAPTTMGLKQEEYIRKLEDIAKGGCAMIIIGDVPVSSSKFGFSLFSKSGFRHYKEITDAVHKYDCLCCAQLHQNDSDFKGMLRYIPKIITGKMDAAMMRKALNDATGKYISSLPESKVKEITSSFGSAAKEAVKAGFDMIEVHGDRMCGSFSSSTMNSRQDYYGGSAENRTHFAVEAVRSVREALPEIPIDYKLAVRQENPHYGNAGVLEEELSLFVPELVKAGVDSFHVTLADHGKLEDTIPPANHPDFGEEGCFIKFCDEVKKYTDLPVCGVGGLTHPEFIENLLEEGRIDMAAMSRQLIADPAWVNKVCQGKENTIRHCIRCNKKCLGGMYDHKGVHCIFDDIDNNHRQG